MGGRRAEICLKKLGSTSASDNRKELLGVLARGHADDCSCPVGVRANARGDGVFQKLDVVFQEICVGGANTRREKG